MFFPLTMIPSRATMNASPLGSTIGSLGLFFMAEYVELISPIVNTPPSVNPVANDRDSAKVEMGDSEGLVANMFSGTVEPSKLVLLSATKTEERRGRPTPISPLLPF